ncbi:MAG: DUF4339 domain-containing protein [Hyphomicrobium sp.]
MIQSEIQWFIARDGQQHGPVTDVEMRKLAELGHLRPQDLVWRQGFPDWRPALVVFPPPPPAPAPAPIAAPVQAAVAAPAPAPVQAPMPAPAAAMASPAAAHPTSPVSPQAAGPLMPNLLPPLQAPPRKDPTTGGRAARGAGAQQPAPAAERGFDPQRGMAAPSMGGAARPGAQPAPFESFEDDAKPRSRMIKAFAAVGGVAVVLGLGTLFIIKTRGTSTSQPVVVSAPSQDQSAALAVAPPTASEQPGAQAEATPALTPNPALDERLQKLPVWKVLKRDFADWYARRLSDAAELTAKGTTAEDLDKFLIGEMVKLRKQNAPVALAAPADKLIGMATAFLDNLKALEAIGVPTCYALISKGETAGALVELLQTPDKGKEINAQVLAVFDAVAAGKTEQIKRESPKKPDYDVLATELGRIGWTQADMQLFSDPRSLASAPPSRVCQMVQDWFEAHLAVTDANVKERLLYETMKPVVGG